MRDGWAGGPDHDIEVLATHTVVTVLGNALGARNAVQANSRLIPHSSIPSSVPFGRLCVSRVWGLIGLRLGVCVFGNTDHCNYIEQLSLSSSSPQVWLCSSSRR